MTDTQALRDLLAAATPGPWHNSDIPGDEATVWQSPSGGAVCWVNEANQTGNHKPYADAALIAAAVSALPDLLAEIAALRRVADAAEAYLANDGSRGLYRAGQMITARESLETALKEAKP